MICPVAEDLTYSFFQLTGLVCELGDFHVGLMLRFPQFQTIRFARYIPTFRLTILLSC